MTIRQILALHNAQIEDINYFNEEEINVRLTPVDVTIPFNKDTIPFGNTYTRELQSLPPYIDTCLIIENKYGGQRGDIINLGIKGGDISAYINLYIAE